MRQEQCVCHKPRGAFVSVFEWLDVTQTKQSYQCFRIWCFHSCYCRGELFNCFPYLMNVVQLLSHVQERFMPHALVSDGQKGLQKAIKMIFPGITHQRCLAHVIRLSLAWLTRNPQTDAGKDLRVLVRELARVKAENQAAFWHSAFSSWHQQYGEFLKEKSCNPETNRKWHTHRKLRAVRSLVLNALPNLFWFVSDKHIPNTTNAVEGGINSPLAELLHRHRGITEAQKKSLVRRFLYARRKKKLPTRNVA